MMSKCLILASCCLVAYSSEDFVKRFRKERMDWPSTYLSDLETKYINDEFRQVANNLESGLRPTMRVRLTGLNECNNATGTIKRASRSQADGWKINLDSGRIVTVNGENLVPLDRKLVKVSFEEMRKEFERVLSLGKARKNGNTTVTLDENFTPEEAAVGVLAYADARQRWSAMMARQLAEQAAYRHQQNLLAQASGRKQAQAASSVGPSVARQPSERVRAKQDEAQLKKDFRKAALYGTQAYPRSEWAKLSPETQDKEMETQYNKLRTAKDRNNKPFTPEAVKAGVLDYARRRGKGEPMFTAQHFAFNTAVNHKPKHT